MNDVEIKSEDVAGNLFYRHLGSVTIDSRTLTAPTIVEMDDNVNSYSCFQKH